MSLDKLHKAIAALPPQNRGPAHVEALVVAAGKTINPEEGARLAELLEKEWKLFTADGRAALEALTGGQITAKQTSFSLAGQFTTGLPEQSALTFVSPAVGFLTIADDSSTVWQLPMPKKTSGAMSPEVVHDGGHALAGLEGAIYDAAGKRLLVLSEDSRKVHSLAVKTGGSSVEVGAPELLGTLADVQELKNKGWEGIAILPASHAGDGKPRLIAAHEGSPRGVGVFDLETLELEALVKVPKEAKDYLADLSDLTVDPKTGRVFLLSHESHAIFEVDLRRPSKMVGGGPPVGEWVMAPIGGTALPVGSAKTQAEGLAFDQHGDLWVSCEKGGRVLHLARGDG